jgi:hypothetical protein
MKPVIDWSEHPLPWTGDVTDDEDIGFGSLRPASVAGTYTFVAGFDVSVTLADFPV